MLFAKICSNFPQKYSTFGDYLISSVEIINKFVSIYLLLSTQFYPIFCFAILLYFIFGFVVCFFFRATENNTPLNPTCESPFASKKIPY